MAAETVLVLGIGNILLSDEGAGVHALRFLQRRRADRRSAEEAETHNVRFLDGGTLSFTLCEPIGQANRLIVLDTAELRSPPGSVALFEDAEMDRFLGHGPKSSVHEVGLAEVLAMVLLEEKLPRQRALIGVQPASFAWGETPTPAVAAAIPRMVEIAERKLAEWGHG